MSPLRLWHELLQLSEVIQRLKEESLIPNRGPPCVQLTRKDLQHILTLSHCKPA